jgi:hypothetical protein
MMAGKGQGGGRASVRAARICHHPKAYFHLRLKHMFGFGNGGSRGSDVANDCKKDLQREGYVGQAAIPPFF